MYALLWNTLKGHRWPMLAMALLLLGQGFLVAASYDAFGRQSIQALAENMPKALAAFMKVEGSLLVTSGAQGYIAVGFRHPIFLVVLSGFAIATASGALAGQIEQRTILVLLARPIQRYELVLSTGLGSLLGLLLLVAALLTGTLVGVLSRGLGDSVDAGPFLLISVNSLCLAAAILGYSYLISALSSEGGRAVLLSTALSVAFFFLDYISGLFDVLEPVGRASVFHYFDPISIAVAPSFPGLHMGILLAVGLITYGAAVMVFQRRDIAA